MDYYVDLLYSPLDTVPRHLYSYLILTHTNRPLSEHELNALEQVFFTYGCYDYTSCNWMINWTSFYSLIGIMKHSLISTSPPEQHPILSILFSLFFYFSLSMESLNQYLNRWNLSLSHTIFDGYYPYHSIQFPVFFFLEPSLSSISQEVPLSCQNGLHSILLLTIIIWLSQSS